MSNKRIRIEGLLTPGVAPSDIAKSEGVSRQYVHQVKQRLVNLSTDGGSEPRLQQKQAAMKARIARRAKRRERHDAKVARLRAEFLACTPGFKPLSTDELTRAARQHLRMERGA